MRRTLQLTASLALAAAISMAAVGCGGGETAVIGFANSDNRLSGHGITEDIAEALAEHKGTPRISDEVVAEIFAAILSDAKKGNPEAALIVLKVAEEQREADES